MCKVLCCVYGPEVGMWQNASMFYVCVCAFTCEMKGGFTGTLHQVLLPLAYLHAYVELQFFSIRAHTTPASATVWGDIATGLTWYWLTIMTNLQKPAFWYNNSFDNLGFVVKTAFMPDCSKCCKQGQLYSEKLIAINHYLLASFDCTGT